VLDLRSIYRNRDLTFARTVEHADAAAPRKKGHTKGDGGLSAPRTFALTEIWHDWLSRPAGNSSITRNLFPCVEKGEAGRVSSTKKGGQQSPRTSAVHSPGQTFSGRDCWSKGHPLRARTGVGPNLCEVVVAISPKNENAPKDRPGVKRGAPRAGTGSRPSDWAPACTIHISDGIKSFGRTAPENRKREKGPLFERPLFQFCSAADVIEVLLQVFFSD